MRSLALVFGLMATAGFAQTGGEYRPSKGQPVAWSISESHSLNWNGEPYLPVGLRIFGSLESISEGLSGGVRDFFVDMPLEGDWKPAVAALEAAGARYVIGVGSGGPAAHGILVAPQRYRSLHVMAGGHFEFEFPGADSVFVTAVTTRDSTVVQQKSVKVVDGKAAFDLELPEDLEHTIYFYPETTSMASVDYWTGFDRHRDILLAKIKSTPFGPGLRGFANPLGQVVSLQTSEEVLVPSDSFFRTALRAYLEERYRNVTTALRSWYAGTTSIDTFEQMARLVPLWSGNRGLLKFYDPETGDTITCSSRRSAAWTDIRKVLDEAAARRFDRLVRSIRAVTDVPVIQEWRGWAAPYEVPQPALSGLGFRASGTAAFQLIESGARAGSSLLRWKSPGWLIASEITLSQAIPPSDAMESLASMGARAFYFRGPASALSGITADPTLATWAPKPLFFPENARSPASPIRLPGGHFWYPSPSSGNVLDLGESFLGYRAVTEEGPVTVLWAKTGSGRVKLRLADPKNVVVNTLDGSDPKIKGVKNGVEVFMSQMPMVFSGVNEVPVPEPSLLETITKFDKLAKIAEAGGADVAQEKFTFQDAARGFDRNPYASLDLMRGQFWRLTVKIAPYVWMEAEGTRQYTFSDTVPTPGAGGGQVLSLRTMGGGTFESNYTIPVRSEEDSTVWIAGRIPPDQMEDVHVSIEGQQLNIEPTPVSTYGQGLCWYRMGVTQLRGTSAKLVLTVSGKKAYDLDIDTMLVAPSEFVPVGSLPPELTPR